MQQTKNKQKPEITLMTLLAYEATEDAQQLLQKYKKPKAKNFADLEVKLGELYVSADDKLKLEREMAKIHPHKKWLMERSEPVVKVEAKKLEVVSEPIKEEKKPDLLEEQKKQMEEFKNELKSVLKEELEKTEKKSGFESNPNYNQMPPFGYQNPMYPPVQMTLPLQPQGTSNFNGEVSSTEFEKQKTLQRQVNFGLAIVATFVVATLWFNYQKNK
jgi:exonuclease VII large subunit